ncbi:hypothetical protein KHS38_06555 [Mucilaginibacter sp. Bleaf8]|uniref:hypothetical protein n=1 Tax=Mucilaginibacter sp. Bleaf8 TaxID=2834430 RepID=UPI001BD018AA|nr:hypothetical protein [Mucilaginibacter sp. Bleaf8]MBS7564062.1 hypothetical protein [Mucilaginibacter sp. Bleaf8]
MNYKIQVTNNGTTRNILIEPSIYQGKKVYQVITDDENMVLYHEDNEWKLDENHHLNPKWVIQIGQAITAIEKLADIPAI